MAGEPILQAEMMELFGENMPMEALRLIMNASDDMTVYEVREALRAIAKKTRMLCPHCNRLIEIPN